MTAMIDTPAKVLDAIEAQARVEMARVAKLPRRGWDSGNERDKAIADVDVLLDQWLALRG